MNTAGQGGAARTGLVLSGGGARAAYQVGALKALAEALPLGTPSPFPVVCGTSAGAINAATLATEAGDFHLAVNRLINVWSNIEPDRVFRTEPHVAMASAARWLGSMLFGGFGRFAPRSILDNGPLRRLLDEGLVPERIQHWIDCGLLHAFSITAASYSTGQSVTFFQGHNDLAPWNRTRRMGLPRPITIDHLMASAAIPVVFPSVRIGYEYYGDGSMRQAAPLSSALHLGADRLLVIGVRHEEVDGPEVVRRRLIYPSVGQIAGYILDTLFLDSLPMDIERLRRMNTVLHQVPPDSHHRLAMRPIELVTLFPSRDIREIAERHVHRLPRSVRYLLRGVGAMNRGGRPLISYLLFESGFCRDLIELGYNDAVRLRPKLLHLVGHPPA